MTFLDPRFSSLEEYTPGEQPKDTVYTKLNTNESPYPAGPKVVEALTDPEKARRLRLYSDPDSAALKKALADRYDVTERNVFVSNGSDDILNFAFFAFGHDGVMFPRTSYGFYQVFGQLHGRDCERVPLTEDFRIRPEDYMNAGKMVVIANPNAPTGRTISLEDIGKICETNPDHVVLIDEAYVDFGAESCVPLTKKYENLLVAQTFSKSRSLAGARLGYAIGSKTVISDLEKIKYSTNPYNVNSLTAAAGIAALSEEDYYKENARKIMATRKASTERFEKLGFQVIPSLANFIFVSSDKIDGGKLYEELKNRKVLIRHWNDPLIENWNRVTIGKPEEMDILFKEIEDILKEA
jgi:histidinol-phosphate aminotransferase